MAGTIFFWCGRIRLVAPYILNHVPYATKGTVCSLTSLHQERHHLPTLPCARHITIQNVGRLCRKKWQKYLSGGAHGHRIWNDIYNAFYCILCFCYDFECGLLSCCFYFFTKLILTVLFWLISVHCCVNINCIVLQILGITKKSLNKISFDALIELQLGDLGGWVRRVLHPTFSIWWTSLMKIIAWRKILLHYMCDGHQLRNSRLKRQSWWRLCLS